MARLAKLGLIEVRDPGAKNERVFMRATADVDLGDFIATDTTYKGNGAVSNKVCHLYEFAKMTIKQGEYVALPSEVGTYKLDETTEGTPLHRFYWGLNDTIWNKELANSNSMQANLERLL